MTQLQKLTISSLDEPNNPAYTVVAQYNPKEIQIDKSVPWAKHKTSKGDDVVLEYSGGEARTMALELFFDSVEKATSVEPTVMTLIGLAKVRDAASTDEAKKRPHQVVVVWGGSGKFPNFKGVIESVSTKFTMFSPDGVPLRATCNVKLKEAQSFKVKAPAR